MGNVIPWSDIHPSIRSEEPFVAVVIVDPQREICISELVPFAEQSLRSPEVAAQEMIGAVQAAAAREWRLRTSVLSATRMAPQSSKAWRINRYFASGFTIPPQVSGAYQVQPTSTVRSSSWTSR